MKQENQTTPEYLGDGVYASFDGYHIILDLRGQDSTTRIALEPPVLEALSQYAENIREMQALHRKLADQDNKEK